MNYLFRKRTTFFRIPYYLCSSNIPAGMITIDQVEPAIRNLPEDLQMQALQYIENLCNKGRNSERRFSFDWIGELEDEESTLSTVDIQHKIHTLKV